MNTYFQPDCEKSSNCTNRQTNKTEEPCKSCHSSGTFSHFMPASVGRPALERSIRDEPPAILSRESGVSRSNLMTSTTDQIKISETCREATRRWKEAEKEAKTYGDKERQKAIHRVISGYLGNIGPNKNVILPDPLTAPIEELSLKTLGLMI